MKTVRRLWRRWLRPRRSGVSDRDRELRLSLDSRDMAAIENYVCRLEASARIGSADAGARLADIAADRVGIARRRFAQDALDRLRKNPK